MSPSSPEEKLHPWEPFPLPEQIEGVPPSAMKLFLAFHKVENTFRQMVLKDLSDGDTHPSQMVCLRLLASTKDGLCQRDIADAMRISRARVTSIVQALERAGAVYRVRDENDHRLTRVFLTDSGRSIDSDKGSLRALRINQVFGDMPDRDRVELERLLEGLTSRLQKVIKSHD